ncbi:MAG: peptidylprolyl isomerase [Lachnospiraceae bacterium]|nr:peptidylprolyl isomerase [Lachnospiraceae bacterium]
MQQIKKWGLVLLLAGILLLSGCKTDLSTEATEKVEVFTVGDEAVYLNEVWIYAKTIQQEYEKNYGSGIWTVELQNESGEAQTVETITKEDIIEEILQVKVLNYKADSFGVALTQEENTQIQQQAESFMAGLTDADIAQTGVTLELAVQVYEENAIASKVYDRIMQEGNVEVSDEQCRQTKVYDLYFPTYIEQGEGDFIALSEDEKTTQHNTATEAYKRIVDSEDSLNIETAAYEYGCTNSDFHTMSYSEYVEQYGQELADQIYAMQDGEILGVVESEYGYHVFQMIALTDAEATQDKKEEMEAEMKKEYFSQVFEKYLKEMDSSWKFSKNVDEDAWNLIRFAPEVVEE